MFREYKITQGKLIGTYKIYLHKEYWLKDYPNVILKEWTIDTEYSDGDWVLSMDGFVVQVLRTRLIDAKRKMLWVRFPMCTVALYQRVDKSIKFTNFYALMTAKKVDSLGEVNDSHAHKQAFVRFLLSGLSPIEALKKATGNYQIKNKYQNTSNATKMLKDQTVRKMIMEEVSLFKDKLNETISDDRILDELDQLLSKSRKGSMAHLGNLKFVMELKGLYQPELPKKKYIEEVNYQEILPQQLPQ